jgi:ATP-dependent DNA helicase RecG
MRGQLGGAEVATRVALLTGSQPTPVRRKQLLDIVSGDAGIIIGTHALIQDTVDFNDLALVVVDEQHRFGVEQRAALAAKSRDDTRPHVLVMTATPIPRTVAMTVFGDVDVSTLSELPSGRAAISTHVVSMVDQPAHVSRVWQRVREEVKAGHRVFVVCPRIGDDQEANDEIAQEELSALSAVLATASRLEKNDLHGLRVDVLHGRMSGEEKDDIMRRFSDLGVDDGIDVLVSTTVIEVGVDVPSATAMIILDADRFGISQLHQLRGRVGRGGLPGLCLLLTTAEAGTPARERLDAVASTTDGFVLAALDLEQRREGDVLGSSQSGHRSSLRLLEVAHHEDVIIDARQVAQTLIDRDPELHTAPALAAAIELVERAEQADYLEKA